jgi:hypothetical protein
MKKVYLLSLLDIELGFYPYRVFANKEAANMEGREAKNTLPHISKYLVEPMEVFP